MKTAFAGGVLSFKGDKKAKTIKGKKTVIKNRKEDMTTEAKQAEEKYVTTFMNDDDMTDAERKAMKKKLEREKAVSAKIVTKSHRERVEEFNEKLSSQTEHNDIPRVSISLSFVFLLERCSI